MALALARAAAADPSEAGAGERLYLALPGPGGAGAYYARLEDLALSRRAGYAKHYPLDRRSGYGHPSRLLRAPLEPGPRHVHPPAHLHAVAADEVAAPLKIPAGSEHGPGGDGSQRGSP